MSVINIKNPDPILLQERSKITTNPFIPNEQKEMELSILDKEANDILIKKNTQSKFTNLSIHQINKNISKSFIGLLDDLFTKPESKSWIEYIKEIMQKDDRYSYIGILLILIAVYMMIVYN